MENEWYERDKTAQRRQSASLSRLSLIVLLMALVASMMLPLYQRASTAPGARVPHLAEQPSQPC